MSRKIIIDFVNPPIPIRSEDYIAYFDGEEEGLNGRGSTEKEAVLNLIEQIEE